MAVLIGSSIRFILRPAAGFNRLKVLQPFLTICSLIALVKVAPLGRFGLKLVSAVATGTATATPGAALALALLAVSGLARFLADLFSSLGQIDGVGDQFLRGAGLGRLAAASRSAATAAPSTAAPAAALRVGPLFRSLAGWRGAFQLVGFQIAEVRVEGEFISGRFFPRGRPLFGLPARAFHRLEVFGGALPLWRRLTCSRWFDTRAFDARGLDGSDAQLAGQLRPVGARVRSRLGGGGTRWARWRRGRRGRFFFLRRCWFGAQLGGQIVPMVGIAHFAFVPNLSKAPAYANYMAGQSQNRSIRKPPARCKAALAGKVDSPGVGLVAPANRP